MKIKKGLFYGVFIILFLPMVQQKLQFIHSGQLNDCSVDKENPVFSGKGWLAGSYQTQKERYLNDNTGFREDMVRLHNQVDYSLFDKCPSGWTVKGKDNYLFQHPYIDAYYGNDFQGYPAALARSLMLKAIQDTLARAGKSLILVFAPNKASFYPEYFPDDRIQQKKERTNYAAYKQCADSLGINNIDMEAWFLAMKNKSREPLFSKLGIHWTYYGALIAADSLTRYMEQLTNIQVQHPVWSRVEHTQSKLGDDDLAQDLNLVFPITKETLAYPVIQDVRDTGKQKINAIYIGDSYGQKMVFSMVFKMNAQCEFWFYFNEVHDINGGKFTYIKDYDWHAAIDKADCVVLVYTMFNLWQLGNGFIEQAYYYYYPNGVRK